ncbi:MAG: hypothetical protein C5B50_28820 [Verrucomicrobia bacterium]|nr:MAG: hypothetical protein C5B50_28820 [Verrucomicrobiota bacterium]
MRANNRSAHEEHRGGRAVQQGTREFPAAPTGRVESERARPAERVTVPERGREHIERSVRGREEIQRELREHRRWDIPEARRHTFFWSDYYPGLAVSILPSGYVPVYVGGSPYYYYQGVFYQQGPSGYSVAPPPIGAVVPELPPGAEPVMVGPATYYYAAGVFYAQEPQGFVVVPPPPGATVSILPPGATSAVVNGVVYYQANGVYYMPVMQDGVTVYTVTRF